jgi:REP element-mobilizing transposase RayT
MRRLKARIVDWHVFNVGSRRMALFRDDQDANVFLSRVRKAGQLAGCLVWAYTLMTNHFHLVLRATSGQLGRFMHHLQRLYSRYHNQRYHLTGHAFAGPYGAVMQSGRAMLARTLAYVFMNPVAARQVDAPEDWSWTSYRSFMGIGESRLWVNALPLLGELDADLGAARERVTLAIEKAKLKDRGGIPMKEPTTTDVHAEQFEWMIERAREWSGDLGTWDPVFLAIQWARDVGIFRTAVAKVLGGPLAGSRRVQFHRFRAWLLTRPELAERLRTP